MVAKRWREEEGIGAGMGLDLMGNEWLGGGPTAVSRVLKFAQKSGPLEEDKIKIYT